MAMSAMTEMIGRLITMQRQSLSHTGVDMVAAEHLALVLNSNAGMDDVRAWRFPAACPSCLALEGVPTKMSNQTDDSMEVWVRCCRCAHEWRVKSDPPVLQFRMKPDRRRRSEG